MVAISKSGWKGLFENVEKLFNELINRASEKRIKLVFSIIVIQNGKHIES